MITGAYVLKTAKETTACQQCKGKLQPGDKYIYFVTVEANKTVELKPVNYCLDCALPQVEKDVADRTEVFTVLKNNQDAAKPTDKLATEYDDMIAEANRELAEKRKG